MIIEEWKTQISDTRDELIALHMIADGFQKLSDLAKLKEQKEAFLRKSIVSLDATIKTVFILSALVTYGKDRDWTE